VVILGCSFRSLLFDLLIATLSGLVTILLVRAVAAVLRIGRAPRRHLAGVWYQTSPDPRGVQDLLRVDQVHLHTIASWIWGYVNRPPG
jgi:hypothetical protein